MMVSPDDYYWLRDELAKGQNCVYFNEYPVGHFGLLAPKDKTMFEQMLELA